MTKKAGKKKSLAGKVPEPINVSVTYKRFTERALNNIWWYLHLYCMNKKIRIEVKEMTHPNQLRRGK